MVGLRCQGRRIPLLGQSVYVQTVSQGLLLQKYGWRRHYSRVLCISRRLVYRKFEGLRRILKLAWLVNPL